MLRNNEVQSGTIRNYSGWKAKTAGLLVSHVPEEEVEMNVDRLLEELEPTLASFVATWTLETTQTLRELVMHAVQLDQEMYRSQALFDVSNWMLKDGSYSGHLFFSNGTMNSPHDLAPPRPNSKVDLVLAPALIKGGNGDGHAFEHTLLLSKWLVVTEDSRKKATNY